MKPARFPPKGCPLYGSSASSTSALSSASCWCSAAYTRSSQPSTTFSRSRRCLVRRACAVSCRAIGKPFSPTRRCCVPTLQEAAGAFLFQAKGLHKTCSVLVHRRAVGRSGRVPGTPAITRPFSCSPSPHPARASASFVMFTQIEHHCVVTDDGFVLGNALWLLSRGDCIHWPLVSRRPAPYRPPTGCGWHRCHRELACCATAGRLARELPTRWRVCGPRLCQPAVALPSVVRCASHRPTGAGGGRASRRAAHARPDAEFRVLPRGHAGTLAGHALV